MCAEFAMCRVGMFRVGYVPNWLCVKLTRHHKMYREMQNSDQNFSLKLSQNFSLSESSRMCEVVFKLVYCKTMYESKTCTNLEPVILKFYSLSFITLITMTTDCVALCLHIMEWKISDMIWS